MSAPDASCLRSALRGATGKSRAGVLGGICRSVRSDRGGHTPQLDRIPAAGEMLEATLDGAQQIVRSNSSSSRHCRTRGSQSANRPSTRTVAKFLGRRRLRWSPFAVFQVVASGIVSLIPGPVMGLPRSPGSLCDHDLLCSRRNQGDLPSRKRATPMVSELPDLER